MSTVTRRLRGDRPKKDEPVPRPEFRRICHIRSGSSATPAPAKRASATSNGVNVRWAKARPTMMNEVQIVTVTAATAMPAARERGIEELSCHSHVHEEGERVRA